MIRAMLTLLIFFSQFSFAEPSPPDSTIAGEYKAILSHEGTKFYQFAIITLKSVPIAPGKPRISANVKIISGDWNSNEFLNYDFEDCPFILFNRQITISNEKNKVKFVGVVKNGTIEGEWFSTIMKGTGKFSATRLAEPKPPQDGLLVKSLTGYYTGTLQNTGVNADFPETVSISLVTTLDTTGLEPVSKISGAVRFYTGKLGSKEYFEFPLVDITFNFYSRSLTAKTAPSDYGLTFIGSMTYEGTFAATIFSDGGGELAKAEFKRVP